MRINISQIIKSQLLKEQGITDKGTSDEKLQRITDAKLKQAYRGGCFRSDFEPYTLDGQVVMFGTSKSRPGYTAFMYPQDSDNGGKLVFMKVVNGLPDNASKIEDRWTCANLRKLTQDTLNPEVETFITDYRNANPGVSIFAYGDQLVTQENKVNGVCSLVKLLDTVPDIVKTRPDMASIITTNVYVWKCGQTSASAGQKAEIAVQEKYGFKLCTQEELVQVKAGSTTIVAWESPGTGKTFCKPNQAGGKIYEALKTAVSGVTQNMGDPDSNEFKENCRTALEQYYKMGVNNLPVDVYEFNNVIKPAVTRCSNSVDRIGGAFAGDKWPKMRNQIQDLGEKTNEFGQKINWSLGSPTTKQQTQTQAQPKTPGFVTGVNESRDRILKKIIRENLIEISQIKKKSLIQENKIIKNRFLIISESGKPKTKQQRDKFVDSLLSEIFYLKSQDFNETLINEQFLEIIKSFFGNAPEGIFNTLKERFAQFVLDKFGIDNDGYIGNIIIVTVGNIPIGDYFNGKIFSCDYLSDLLSKSIGEGIVRKIQNDRGMEGPFYDILRNAMVETFEDTKFGQKIENFIGDLICPSLSGVKNKMELAGETLKDKALS